MGDKKRLSRIKYPWPLQTDGGLIFGQVTASWGKCPICGIKDGFFINPHSMYLPMIEPTWKGLKTIACQYCKAEWLLSWKRKGLFNREFQLTMRLVKPSTNSGGLFTMRYGDFKPVEWWLSDEFKKDLHAEKQARRVRLTLTCETLKRGVPLTRSEKIEEWLTPVRIVKTERPTFSKDIFLESGAWKQVLSTACPFCDETFDLLIWQDKVVQITVVEAIKRIIECFIGGSIIGLIIGLAIIGYLRRPLQLQDLQFLLFFATIIGGGLGGLLITLESKRFSLKRNVNGPDDPRINDPPIELPPGKYIIDINHPKHKLFREDKRLGDREYINVCERAHTLS